MKKTILITIAFLVILTSAAAGGKKDSTPTPSGPGVASGEGRTIKIGYRIDKTQAGSKSEGRSHVLTINGYELPDAFETVYAANTLYTFKTKTQMWGDGGYMRERDSQAPYGETDKEIGDKDWELGWYEEASRKAKTPRSWVYVERDGLKAFISPDELERYITWKGFEMLERDSSGPVLLKK